jgi:hypothetical protein
MKREIRKERIMQKKKLGVKVSKEHERLNWFEQEEYIG